MEFGSTNGGGGAGWAAIMFAVTFFIAAGGLWLIAWGASWAGWNALWWIFAVLAGIFTALGGFFAYHGVRDFFRLL